MITVLTIPAPRNHREEVKRLMDSKHCLFGDCVAHPAAFAKVPEVRIDGETVISLRPGPRAA